MNIAVVGLGIMGSRLARRLIDAGFEVRGFDISAEAMAGFEEMGGVAASSPAEAVADCEIAVLSLLTSDIAREVCLGSDGIASTAQRPLLVLDATTGRPEDSMATAERLAALGIEYADMTVSGNAAVAEQGGLVIMLGGTADAYHRAVPVMEVLGRSHHHVGPVGSGARMKLIVNHVLAVNRGSLAEGLVVAEKAGLDLEATLEVLRDSAAYSRAMDLWGDRMVAGDHERPNARLRQSHKDSKLILEQAVGLGAPADHIRMVEAALDEGETRGLADKDNSSAIEVIRRRAGIGRVSEE
jgi:3-hydroxyisobutyrate dehydrogenase-like beta-hydroxyacid dehydrogenase